MEYGLTYYRKEKFEDVLDEVPKNGILPVENGQTNRIGEIAYAEWKLENFSKEEEEGILIRQDEILEADWKMENSLQAPVEKGTVIGKAMCLLNGEVLLEKRYISRIR